MTNAHTRPVIRKILNVLNGTDKIDETEHCRKMLSDFGDFVGRNGKNSLIHDTSKLPYPKDALFKAMYLELICSYSDSNRTSWLLTGIVFLADFQPGVGDEPLWAGGINPNMSAEELRKQAMQDTADSKNQDERWAKFSKLVQVDRQRMQAEALKAIEIGRLMSPEIKRELFGV